MRLLFIAFLLAAAPAWADPPSDSCRYMYDVVDQGPQSCATMLRSIPREVRESLLRTAAARRAQVLALVAAMRASPPGAAEALRDPRFLLNPRFNARTLPAWLDEADALLASQPVQEAVSAWTRDREAEEAARPQRPDTAIPGLDAVAIPVLSPEDAALTMDGALARGALGEDPFAGPSGLLEGRRVQEPRPAPSEAVAPRPSVNDLTLRAPPTPVEAPVGRPIVPEPPRPRVVPGEDTPESLDISVDREANPCVDFFAYACGSWLRDHPLGDNAVNSRFLELYWRNISDVRVRVEALQRASPGENPPDQQRLGDFYAACTDERAIERLGTRPLTRELSRLREVNSLDALADAVADSHRQGLTGPFSLASQQDPREPAEIIASVRLAYGGLNRTQLIEEAHADKRAAYSRHIAAMFRLAGENGATAAAAAVLRIETGLARGMLTEEQERDPHAIYHRMPVSALVGLAPSFPWARYFARVGAPGVRELNVTEPTYIAAFESLLRGATLEQWRSYLAWKVISDSDGQLPERFRDEARRFANELDGSRSELNRSEQCLQQLNDAMPEAVGQAFVDARFTPRARAAMEELTEAVRTALTDQIRAASWMSPSTREQALAKAAAMRLKVGSPQPPEDYNGLHVARGDAFGNARRASTLAFSRELARIGRPRDPNEWYLPANIVNAYYDPLNNEIVFPAGILQPPFFDSNGSSAVNYGAIGAIIGHEMVHGFDDQGRQHDAEGRLRDWWTPEDAQAYMSRAGAFVSQYAAQPQEAGGTVMVNPRLTLGENIADNGGLRAAYAAYMSRPGPREGQDGFTAEQSFFLGFGRVWCGQSSSQVAEANLSVETHAPARVRVNGSVANMPEFRQAFSCAESSPMVNRAPTRLF